MKQILRREAWEAELYRRHPALAALEAQKKELFLRQLERVLHAPGDQGRNQGAGRPGGRDHTGAGRCL